MGTENLHCFAYGAGIYWNFRIFPSAMDPTIAYAGKFPWTYYLSFDFGIITVFLLLLMSRHQRVKAESIGRINGFELGPPLHPLDEQCPDIPRDSFLDRQRQRSYRKRRHTWNCKEFHDLIFFLQLAFHGFVPAAILESLSSMSWISFFMLIAYYLDVAVAVALIATHCEMHHSHKSCGPATSHGTAIHEPVV